ncbi:tail fiber assembly protein [Yersinia aldovae]|uniref:tail fiber assembly protein n=1 Tax=Yersinia aldovae TaxID=29483 RepID=UPI0028F40C10|nr:tail fiber assembly protein [Yersinia aldovae]
MIYDFIIPFGGLTSSTDEHESIIFAQEPIPHNQTLIPPTHKFNTWMGTAWEGAQEELKASSITAATQQKTALIKQVSGHINILLDAIATNNRQTDIQQLAAFKHYRIALMHPTPRKILIRSK